MSRAHCVGGLGLILVGWALAAGAHGATTAPATAAPLEIDKLKLVQVFGAGPFRHGGQVQSIHVLKDGKQILTAGDGIVQWWDAATGKSTRRLSDEGVQADRVVVVGDRVLALGTTPGHEIGVWDLDTGAVVRSLPDAMMPLGLSPDGRLAVTMADLGEVTVTEVATGAVRQTLRKGDGLTPGVAVSADGRYVATAGDDGAIRFWNLESGQEAGKVEVERAMVRHLSFSPKEPVCAGVVGRGTGQRLELWEAPAGRVRWTVAVTSGVFEGVVAFSPEGELLAVPGGDKQEAVVLRQTRDGKEVRRLEMPWRGMCRALAFSPDGREVLAEVDGWLCRWAAESGRRIFPTTEVAEQWPPLGMPLFAGLGRQEGGGLVLAPDGRRAYTCALGGNEILVRDLAAGGRPVTWRATPSAPGLTPHLPDLALRTTGLTLSPDGRKLLVSGILESVVLDTATGQVVQAARRGPALMRGTVWLDGGKTVGGYGRALGEGGEMATGWMAWDVETGEARLLRRAEMPLGLRVVAAGGRVALLQTREAIRVLDLQAGVELGAIPMEEHHYLQMCAAADTGGCLLGYDLRERRLVQWQVLTAATRPVAATLLARWVQELGAPDAAVRVTATAKLIEAGPAAEGALAKADPQDAEAQERVKQVREGWQKRVTRIGECAVDVRPTVLAFHPDGRHWALAGRDGGAVVLGECTPQGPKMVGKLADWRRPGGLAWSGDGKTLAVTNRDGTLSVYRAE